MVKKKSIGFRSSSVNSSSKERGRGVGKFQIFLLVLLIVIGVAAVFALVKIYAPSFFGKSSLYGELAAKVDGKQITMQELNTAYERLPLQYRMYVTKEDLLSQMIDEVLVINDAAKQGITVTELDIDDNIRTFLTENNLSQEAFTVMLKNRSISNAEIRSLIRNQITVSKVLEKEVKNKTAITSEEALQYYNDNSKLFMIPELATVRHILIGTDNRSAEDAKKLADQVSLELKTDKSNFCELVTKYSEDPGSLQNCGEYTFPRGQMAEEFENKAFEQNTGAVGIATTMFGQHIIWTVNKTAERMMSFKDIEAQIKQLLANEKETKVYADYLSNLRSSAQITNYLVANVNATEEEYQLTSALEDQSEMKPESDAEPKATQSTVKIVSDNDATTSVAESGNAADNNLEPAISQPEAQPQEKNTPVASAEPTAESTPIAQAKPAAQQTEGDRILCFIKKAKIYGAFWDSSTKKQLDLFGDDAHKVSFVECGVKGDYSAQTDDCKKQGVDAYPTWFIDGRKYLGVYSQEELMNIAGC